MNALLEFKLTCTIREASVWNLNENRCLYLPNLDNASYGFLFIAELKSLYLEEMYGNKTS